jgi:hypothetical protein
VDWGIERLGLGRSQKAQYEVGIMNDINAVITPTIATDLIGLRYRNPRTSCVRLALLCTRVSHDLWRRVLSQKVSWSRRLGEAFAQGLVQKGGSLVIEDTSGERFPASLKRSVGWGPVVWGSRCGEGRGCCGCGQTGSGKCRLGSGCGGRGHRH